MLSFRKHKEKSRTHPKPPWLMWMLVFFIAYSAYVMSKPGTGPNKSMRIAKDELSSEIDLKGYKDKIFPEHAAGLRIRDMEVGIGDPAICGQQVSITYDSYLAQGNQLPDSASKEKPLKFTIGDGHVMPVFGNGVIGMKEGGKRSIVAPPLMSYGLEDYRREDVPDGATVRMEIEMLSISPKLPDLDTVPYRIAEVSVGNGPMIICGEPASLRVKMWDLNGKLLYDNKDEKDPMLFTPGRSEVMLGLEQGVIGMNQGGTRLLVIPKQFQSTMSGKEPKFALPLPKDQVVMVEAAAHIPEIPAQQNP